MQKILINLTVLLLLGTNIACNNNDKEVEATTNNGQTVNEKEIVELETTTEEMSSNTIQMEEEVNELSNEVDSLLNDI